MRILRINSNEDANGRPIAPQAQARPRFGFGRAHSPKTAWYHLVKWRALQEAPAAPLDGPIGMEVTFIFARLKTGAPDQVYKWTRPDADNLIKAVKDALSQAAWWVEDSRVADERTIKRYAAVGEDPGALIRVWPLADPAWARTAERKTRTQA